MEAPDARTTLKLDGLTVIDWMVALDPETLIVYPPTEIMASVVRVTSFAAKTNVGAKIVPRAMRMER